ncbi:MAG TPA: hypothetical protein VI603_11565 [Saprospiraceae bacterium]|nr:hypothetical protein [Saprospiraceae bacterium]
MESIRWRYQPEFRINVTIEGLPVISGLQLIPTFQSCVYMQNYSAITQSRGGTLLFSVKQNHNGVTWIPAIPLTTPFPFAFGLRLNGENPISPLDFFSQGNSTFGRRILYVNNLSPAGAIDSNLIGNNVRLTAAADVSLTDSGSLSAGIPSAEFTPGTFTQFRAGKVRAGSAVTFTTNQTIANTDRRASFDMTLRERGSYVLRLEGGAPIQEFVVVDTSSAQSAIIGIVEIFRDAWLAPLLPRNYTINFTAV